MLQKLTGLFCHFVWLKIMIKLFKPSVSGGQQDQMEISDLCAGENEEIQS